jgi:CubicO group peptidase (beta-lactamase class C family)
MRARGEQARARVDAWRARRRLTALDVFQGAVLVAHGDQVLLAKGYGLANVELGVRNTPANVFRVASLTPATSRA